MHVNSSVLPAMLALLLAVGGGLSVASHAAKADHPAPSVRPVQAAIPVKFKLDPAPQEAAPAAAMAGARFGQALGAKLRVRIRHDGTGASLGNESYEAVRKSIAADPSVSSMVDLVDKDFDFEVVQFTARQAAITGPEGAIRKTFAIAAEGKPEAGRPGEGVDGIVSTLWSFARQGQFLALKASPGVSPGRVALRTIPDRGVDNCRGIDWKGDAFGEAQAIPLCQSFRIEARMPADAPAGRRLYLLILSSDGSILRQVTSRPLNPGEVYSGFVFQQSGATGVLRASLPVNLPDQVVAISVADGTTVDLPALTARVGAPSADPVSRELAGLLRGDKPAAAGGAARPPAWKMDFMSMRAIASDLDAGKLAAAAGPPSLREYTINGFDITPYLPADTGSSLFRVLSQANWLASYAKADGVPYKQHEWTGEASAANDPANLKAGIDCSRSIWFAFVRAGLPYNRSNRYLATADMITPESWMNDQFDMCTGDLQTGDILVYRDEARGVGHTVMVIDPQQRVAWGSHGWDGNAKLMNLPADTGVEYQLIKFKKDWERWDTAKMVQKACWRYRAFKREWINPGARAGSTQLKGCKNMCPKP